MSEAISAPAPRESTYTPRDGYAQCPYCHTVSMALDIRRWGTVERVYVVLTCPGCHQRWSEERTPGQTTRWRNPLPGEAPAS